MTIKLIVGLGNNIGVCYFNTRHNFGARYVELLATHYKVNLNKNYILCGYLGQWKLENHTVYLLIPKLYMNDNGIAVSKCVDFYKLYPNEILIAYDDLDLLPGVIRIKLGDKINNSHRGVKDVIFRMNNRFDFYRLRIGIGHPGSKNKVVDFVLNKPSVYEQDRINGVINKAILYTKDMVIGKFIKVMNYLHAHKPDY